LHLFDEAEAAFQEALAIVVRNEWRPWEAWTRLRHARMLRARGGPGDLAEALVQEAVSRLIGTELGMPALLLECGAAAASDPASSGPSAADARPDEARDAIRLEGDVWAITFEGRTVRLRDARGLWYLARLLSSPGQEVASVDLLLAAHQVPASAPATGADDLRVGGDSADPVLDAAARAAYRARLMELQEDIEEATRFGDVERVEYMRTEFEAITRELTLATGIGGRVRGHVTPAERARQSVTKAIHDTLRRIEQLDPDLGAHLRHSVRTGMFCAYLPDPRAAISWSTSAR
jgi:hypothetical protein